MHKRWQWSLDAEQRPSSILVVDMLGTKSNVLAFVYDGIVWFKSTVNISIKRLRESELDLHWPSDAIVACERLDVITSDDAVQN